jgi:hypothetical protein
MMAVDGLISFDIHLQFRVKKSIVTAPRLVRCLTYLIHEIWFRGDFLQKFLANPDRIAV